jgi:hypothetical protein
MSQRSQQDGITACRNHLDDQYDGKLIFQFSPLIGVLDGSNRIFQIPQGRIVVNLTLATPVFPQLYKNDAALVFNTDYTVLNAKAGIFQLTVAPKMTDDLKATVNWTWMDDIEIDHHLNRGANEIGLTSYFTNPPNNGPTIPGTEPIPVGGSQSNDIDDGLFNAIIQFGAAYAAEALALRFSTKYDFSAGDQNFSPSQMAQAYTDLAKDLRQKAFNARDDFYKGQGRQYRPSITQKGYPLPPVTPPR